MSPSSTHAGRERSNLWRHYRATRLDVPEAGLTLDVSRVRMLDKDLIAAGLGLEQAIHALQALESGAIANVSEERMVGHYWLRTPDRAPTRAIASRIQAGHEAVTAFADAVRDGSIRGIDGRFEHVIHVGIGGSATGPQFLCQALQSPGAIVVDFLDNADPAGVDRLLARLQGQLGRTLVSVVSKCGWTPTPIQLTAELRSAYAAAGVRFDRHAVATTTQGSPLDQMAAAEGWLMRFPLWDWVGGRTSTTSAVGLLPAALQGANPLEILAGAALMDERTREQSPAANPAAVLAAAWYQLGNGRGSRQMVVLPFGDALSGFPRFVQQLVMESLGKRHDRAGNVVEQGLTVYGHKGSSDGHSYFQQLRDGTPNAFVTFVSAHRGRHTPPREIHAGATLDDYLAGYVEAAREALYENGRDSIHIALDAVSERCLGGLIALYERAVGLYGELIDVNAYDQPAIDKLAAEDVVELQRRAVPRLRAAGVPLDAQELATEIGRPEAAETVFKILERLAVAGDRGVHRLPAVSPFDARFQLSRNTPGTV